MLSLVLRGVAITCIVESKKQRTRDGEREEPHHSNHHRHPPPGTVSGVVEHGHGHRGVSVVARTHTRWLVLRKKGFTHINACDVCFNKHPYRVNTH